MKRTKPPKSNISKEEARAIKRTKKGPRQNGADS